MSLLVVGTVALDSLKTPSGVREKMLGGSAAHFCMSSRFFTDVHLAAIVGRDFPQKYVRFLKDRKIDLRALQVGDDKTFHWQGEYKKENWNTALTRATELGVLAKYIPSVVKEQKGIPYVFLANIDPGTQMGILDLMKRPKLVGLDSMNLWINHQRKDLLKLMKRVDLFVANDAEAKDLSGEDNLIKAAKRLSQFGPSMVVVKKGEHGVLFYCKEFTFAFPAYPVEKVVDPTGAGDTFAGGLMGYLSKSGKTNLAALKKAVLYATTAASFNVEAFGMSKTGKLRMSDLNSRMKHLTNYIRP